QVVEQPGRRLRPRGAQRRQRSVDLLLPSQLGRAPGAPSDMCADDPSTPAGEFAADQERQLRAGLAAEPRLGLGRRAHASPARGWPAVTRARSRVWARCSRTLTTVSVTPSNSATSRVDKPSRSLNTTTARASSGSAARAAPDRA